MNINEIIDQMESGLEVALPGPWVFHPGTMRAIIAYVRELEARAEAAEAKVARLRETLADLRKTAALLQQNALGCATNHYGKDFQLHGMPKWLVDTAASIERARKAMEATDE